MWIHPVSPKDLAHPKRCEDCGAQIIFAKNEKDQSVAVNASFRVLQTFSMGDDDYWQLLADDASHTRTCAQKAPTRPAMTRKGRKKNVDIRT